MRIKLLRWVVGASLATLLIGVVIPASGATKSSAPPTRLAPAQKAPKFVPGELIVRFKPGLNAASRSAALRAEGATLKQRLGLPGTVLVRLPSGESVGDALARFAARSDVVFAEPNLIYQPTATPNDPRFGDLWGLNQANDADIDAPKAWDVTTGDSNVIVGVVDSGVAYGHPDLAPNIWTNDDPPGGGDQDGNGRVDDTHGWDFVQNDNTPLDLNGHGTHVAGTIGAQGNNALGVTGVNWDVSIMPLRAGNASGSLTDAAIVNAFNYACAEGADIVNGSFGASTPSATIAAAVTNCPGVLFVFAAGNDGKDLDGSGTANDAYPCELHRAPTSAPNVLCVAATDSNDQLADFSNHGSQAVHLAAPGVDILSSWPDYQAIGGTDGFDDATQPAFEARWGDKTSTAGDQLWDRTSAVKRSGTHSLTDSPAGNYTDGTQTSIRRLAAFDLAGQTGCRIDYFLRLQTELGFDFFQINAGTTTATPTGIEGWSGSTGGQFLDFSGDLSMFDGQAAVYIRFWLLSDATNNFDGAYVEDVLVKCLDSDGEDYQEISGTSMASPHVAGVAALLLADDPTLTVAQLKTDLTSSVDVKASLDDTTITEGRLNACKALGQTAAQCDPDTRRPQTTITSGPSGRTFDRTPRFTFRSNEPGSTFQCKLDRAAFRNCRSPRQFGRLPFGAHVFLVRAIDRAGNRDNTPARRNFTIRRRR